MTVTWAVSKGCKEGADKRMPGGTRPESRGRGSIQLEAPTVRMSKLNKIGHSQETEGTREA